MNKSEMPSQTQDRPRTYKITVIKGKLIDQDTGKEIRLEDGTKFEVELSPSSVFYKDKARYAPSKEVKMIDKKEVLTFSIREYELAVRLEEDLMLKITKGKRSRLIPSKCTILYAYPKGKLFNKEILFNIEVDSLNRAYTVAYNHLFPNQGANNRNVFDVMHYNGKPLNSYREIWEGNEKIKARLKRIKQIKNESDKL